ncbi:MAG: adenosylcobinamide-GDP ribazoletransferase [Candidatus Brocadiia bacterium]
MPRALVTALRTLTILPVAGREADDVAEALRWFPVVGLLLGLLLWGVASGVDALTPGGWSGGAAVAVVVAYALLTRGFHLDGLADWADGFWGGWDREGTLRIMKDSRTGAFGVVAVVCALLARWVAVTRLIESGGLLWLLAAAVTARAMAVELAVWLPYARPEGGTGGVFVNDARLSHYLWSVGSAWLILCATLGPVGPVALGLGWLVVRLYGVWCRRRVGGVTGDLLGAGTEIVETTVLLVAAALASMAAPVTGWSAFVG